MKTIIGVIFLVCVFLVALTAIDMGTNYLNSSLFSSTNEIVEPSQTASVITVSITGQVQKPGSYTLAKGSFLKDVIEAAGGVTTNADSDCYNLYLEIEDSMDIYIPIQSDDEKISINEADLEELTTLSGIGKTIGGRIIAFRERYGDFEYLEQLMEVDGIGKTIFNNIKDNICL